MKNLYYRTHRNYKPELIVPFHDPTPTRTHPGDGRTFSQIIATYSRGVATSAGVGFIHSDWDVSDFQNMDQFERANMARLYAARKLELEKNLAKHKAEEAHAAAEAAVNKRVSDAVTAEINKIKDSQLKLNDAKV